MDYTENDFIVNQDFDISTLEYENLDIIIKAYDDFASTSKKCFFVFDYCKHDYVYIKSYNEYFTEIPEEIVEPYTFYNSMIHHKDLEFVHQIHHRVFDYVPTIKHELKKNLKLYYSCRFKNCNNEYVMSDISIKLLKTDISGNIWLALFVIEKSFSENYKIPYIENQFGDIRQFTLNQELLSKLTDAEKEILFLTFGNYNNNDIAVQLFKTYATVRSHLKSINKKFKTKDKLDLQRRLLMK